jgi:hypothetical protein
MLEAVYVDHFKASFGEFPCPPLQAREMGLMVGICEIDEDDINFRIVST